MHQLLLSAANNKQNEIDVEDFGVPKNLFVEACCDLSMSSSVEDAHILFSFLDRNKTGKVTEDEWGVFDEIETVADEEALMELFTYNFSTCLT